MNAILHENRMAKPENLKKSNALSRNGAQCHGGEKSPFTFLPFFKELKGLAY
jgi:hypothetical protein